MYITECTLELQGLSGGELAELAWRQSELVSLKLQSDRSLWLGDAILTACYVGQLGNLYHISTFNGNKENFTLDTLSETTIKRLGVIFGHWNSDKTRYSASVSLG